uniref:ETAA1 activator of ATR kinase b n=1 Tax=Takifugu rubripes TaxID=31033 RepID=A0A674NWF1_TAKRU
MILCVSLTGLQSPKALNCRRFTGFYNGDSPGDVEPSQDIIWDSTSPTAATSVKPRSHRVVEISDIVNRIAPKVTAESALLQWIGDSVPCTPDIPKHRVRRKQNTVEDLVKLARQFDKNMQDRESLEGIHNNFNSSVSDCANTSKPKLRPADKMKGLQCSSSSDAVEAELQALFDCSTQKVSGRLSQGSSASARSQVVEGEPVAAHLVETGQTRLKASEKSVPAAEVKAAALGSNDDFDDDWENDDLLNDPLLLELTQNPPRLLDKFEPALQSYANTENSQSHSGFQSTTKTMCAHQPTAAKSKLTCSTLQELCPKPKTTHRSTFKLEPNPHFQAKNAYKPTVTDVQSKLQICPTNLATTKTLCKPDKTTDFKGDICEAADSLQGISDSLWDDGDDDTLLYQVCDSVERISNSQLDQVSFRHKKQYFLEERGQKGTTTSQMSQKCIIARNWKWFSFGSRGVLLIFYIRIIVYGCSNLCERLFTVVDSSISLCRGKLVFTCSCLAVFVTSQATGKCSAADIERKKQEALARRRQRLQNEFIRLMAPFGSTIFRL